jgi:hypothetical protein
MSTTVERLTVEEFLAREWPPGTQLIDGVVVLSSPKLLHQRVLGDLFALLHGWTRGATGTGEVLLPLAIALISPQMPGFEVRVGDLIPAL